VGDDVHDVGAQVGAGRPHVARPGADDEVSIDGERSAPQGVEQGEVLGRRLEAGLVQPPTEACTS